MTGLEKVFFWNPLFCHFPHIEHTVLAKSISTFGFLNITFFKHDLMPQNFMWELFGRYATGKTTGINSSIKNTFFKQQCIDFSISTFFKIMVQKPKVDILLASTVANEGD
jgi:hypothetical protein